MFIEISERNQFSFEEPVVALYAHPLIISTILEVPGTLDAPVLEIVLIGHYLLLRGLNYLGKLTEIIYSLNFAGKLVWRN